MTKFFLIFALFFASLFILKSEESEEEIKNKLPLIQGISNAGTEFVFTIPPVFEASEGNNNIKIFITSTIQTKVQLEIKKINLVKTAVTKPNDVISIDLTPTEGQPFLYNPNTMIGKSAQIWYGAGIRITSEYPIVVYVICKYYHAAGGFLALPVTGLDKEYVVATYNDKFPPWAGITAAYDNTDFTVTMGGNANSEIITKFGTKIKPGQKIPKFRLQKGNVYMFSSNGPNQDISGSKIIANKPFSLVTGNYCAYIPLSNEACDYTVDMQFPTSTWGQLYHIPAITPRRYNGIIRVFAKEDNTNVYRDGKFWFNIPNGGGIEGTGWREMRIWEKTDDLGKDINPKNAVVSADKPIGITYYNTGTFEDGNLNSTAPFIMSMIPLEQFQNEITFLIPNLKDSIGSISNFINVVYETDEFGWMPDDFEYSPVNGGRYSWRSFNSFFGGTGNLFEGGVDKGVFDINGKKYGSKHVQLADQGVFKLRSKTGKFACYSYGIILNNIGKSYSDAYGSPTSAALLNLEIPDQVASDPNWKQECNGDVLDGSVTDRPDNPALRSNLNYIAIDNSTSYNYKFEFNPVEGGTTITTSWKLTVLDPFKDARADLIFIDRAGNDTTITIEYSATKYEITTDHNYGLLPFGESSKFDYTIKNISESKPLTFKDLKLKYGNQGFSIDTPLSWDINLPVEPLGTRKVTVTFTADDKLPADKKYFLDSLGIGYDCGFANFVKLEAGTGAPKIFVEDFDFGKINVNLDTPKQTSISIRNNGNTELIITSYTDLTLPEFTTDLYTIPKFANISVSTPLVIKPGQIESFNVFFKPTAISKYSDQIRFYANFELPSDPICKIKGEGVVSQLQVNSFNWFNQKLESQAIAIPAPLDANGDKVITLTNAGSAAITITNISLVGTTTDENSFVFADGKPLNQANLNATFANKQVPAGGKLTADVLYLPKFAGHHKLEITFNNSENIPNVVSTLAGRGADFTGIENVESNFKLINTSNTLITLAITQDVIVDNQSVSLLDILGNIINVEVNIFGNQIEIKPINKISTGTYFIQINKTNTIKIQIN